MPQLKNRKHELFAQALARGETLASAYEWAGNKPCKTSAWNLLHSQQNGDAIQERIEELRREALRRNEITVDRILEEWRRLAFADMRALAEWDDKTARLKPSSEIDDEAAAAVQELSVSPSGRTKIKLADKTKALTALSRYVGLDLSESTTTVEPLQERLQRLMQQRATAASLSDRIEAARQAGTRPDPYLVSPMGDRGPDDDGEAQ